QEQQQQLLAQQHLQQQQQQLLPQYQQLLPQVHQHFDYSQQLSSFHDHAHTQNAYVTQPSREFQAPYY
ncbi:PREDICTED: sex-determining region Y protein-like, partial [Drosophila arizonae]|uniref:Sex-determining region Y protein-like n=1 Tax=Drosophila arizonae TaxID=7263 RepID=A0ABM1PSP4_DROAR